MEKYLMLVAMLLCHTVWYFAYGYNMYYDKSKLKIIIESINWILNILLFPMIYFYYYEYNLEKTCITIIIAIIFMIIHWYFSYSYCINRDCRKRDINIIHILLVVAVWIVAIEV